MNGAREERMEEAKFRKGEIRWEKDERRDRVREGTSCAHRIINQRAGGGSLSQTSHRNQPNPNDDYSF